jgi:hypothetical protein
MVTEFQTPDKESMKVLPPDNCGLATAATVGSGDHPVLEAMANRPHS